MNIVKITLVIILILITIIYLFQTKEYFTNKNENKNKVLTYEDNIPNFLLLYGKNGISIGDTKKYGRCLVIDNEIQLCDKQEHIYHELIVHFGYQYLSKPLKKVLIIGGGDLMTLREVMKYKTIEKVYMLELNKTIVKKCKKYFDVTDYPKDDRVEIIYGDAYQTIDTLKNEIGQIDMCIIDTTEDNSNNLSIDRISFFEKCFKLLNIKGVLIKNGEYFSHLLSNKMGMNCINFGAYMPYFNAVYQFVICGKKGNNLQGKHIYKDRWLKEKVKTNYYDVSKHEDYILYDVFNYIKY